MKIPIANATVAQISHIELLLIDVQVNERERRNAYLTLWLNRPVKFLDELTKAEASTVIDELKRIKEEQRYAAEMENAKRKDRYRR